jgi:lysophospholipase L1-like esterase
MKILVLGHSDSDGSRLANRHDGWPWVLQSMLAEHQIEAEVVHRLLFAGPTASSYLERQLLEHEPDIVFVATSGYGVVVQLVSNRVRATFGNRAAGLVVRGERAAVRWSSELGPRGNRWLHIARRTGRKVLGTRPSLTFAELVESYRECFRLLARREQTHTIVFGGLGYGTELQRLNPRLNELQDRFHQLILATAAEYHFEWVIHEEILGGRQRKLRYLQRDGVHSNEAAQRLAAEAVLPLVLAKL